MIDKILPYVLPFVSALALTLVLTPLVREMNRKLGMIDKPDPRRINKVPIPRGGGLALFLGTVVPYAVLGGTCNYKIVILSLAMVAIGYTDDKFGMNPKVKLLGQLLVAFLTWFWAGFGFRDLWPSLPAYLDCVMTVFWIAGAINAFNLIDGLDGLASGLGLIATLGMTGALMFSGHAHSTLFCFAFMGGLLGFLRYNWNPASVFLGDSGSMFIGYSLSVLALSAHTPNSFLVSVGVPILAMGVPIFDTSLAIIRRSIRRLLNKGGAASGNGEVMTADTDHLHHRILRSSGNQRKAALTLYAGASALVLVGLVAVSLESRAAGLWLAALAAAVIIVCRDMSRIELFDAGMLLNRVARANDTPTRRRRAKLVVPFYLATDVLILAAVYVFCCWALKLPLTAARLRSTMPIQVVSSFAALVFLRTYVTIWSRAVVSNYLRLLLACGLGSIVGSIAIYYIPTVPASQLKLMTILYAMLPFACLMATRILRQVVRDLFYALDCRRLIGRKDVSRILVYGSGLRYRAFRRELVRSAASNNRMIVGLLDDDILLRNHYIGGVQVKGTIHDAPGIITAHNVDAVVIAFDVAEEKLKIIKEILAPTGVKITRFFFTESAI